MVENGMTAAERSYDAELRSHRYNFHQVMFPSLGQLSLRFGDEPGYVGEGRLAFVAAGVDHAFRADGPNRVLVADVPVALADGDAPSGLLAGFGAGAFVPLDAKLAALAAAIRTELHVGGLGDPLVVGALGRYIMAAIRRAGNQEPPLGSSLSSKRLANSAQE